MRQEVIALSITICLVMTTIAVYRLSTAISEIRAENKCIAAHIAHGVPRADIWECTTHDK